MENSSLVHRTFTSPPTYIGYGNNTKHIHIHLKNQNQIIIVWLIYIYTILFEVRLNKNNETETGGGADTLTWYRYINQVIEKVESDWHSANSMAIAEVYQVQTWVFTKLHWAAITRHNTIGTFRLTLNCVAWFTTLLVHFVSS